MSKPDQIRAFPVALGIAFVILIAAALMFLNFGSGDSNGSQAKLRPPVISPPSISCEAGYFAVVTVRARGARRLVASAVLTRTGTVIAKGRTARRAKPSQVVRVPLGSAAASALPWCRITGGTRLTVTVTAIRGRQKRKATRSQTGRPSRAVTTRRIVLGPVAGPVSEASGLAESRREPGIFYTHDDSGGDASVYVLGEDASLLAEQPISGVSNRDWEDIALGPGPLGPSIYVGEIGDNSAVHPSVFIYRIPEPSSATAAAGGTLPPVEPDVLELVYPDGARDAEALVVDPADGTIYLITKREERSRVYRAAASGFGTGSPVTMEFLGELPAGGAVAADACPDGQTVLVKTYLGISAFISANGIASALAASPSPRFYQPILAFPQDESVAADPWCTGYSVLPEGSGAPLARYTP